MASLNSPVTLDGEDFRKIAVAVNIALNLLHHAQNSWTDLDGEVIEDDFVQYWKDRVDEGVDALLRAKYS